MRFSLILLTLLVAALPQTAVAGVIQERPVVAPDRLIYDDEVEFKDGFAISEQGVEVVFTRTTGELPLRTTRQACTAESDDLVRCGDLEGIGVLELELIAGDDEVDASEVRSFRIVAHTGSGNAKLTGGALDDELSSDTGGDELSGGPGNDVLTAGAESDDAPDRDILDGGPGRDRMSTGPDADVVLARDGEADQVDCGAGAGDRVVADRIDELVGCEIVDYPPPPPSPIGSSTVTVSSGPDLSTVVRFPRARCLPRRIRVAPVNGFVPATTVLWARGRVVANGTGERHTLRIPRLKGRRVTLRAAITGADGSRVTTSRAYRIC